MEPNKERVEVLVGGKWVRPIVCQDQPSGWLHYELNDGTIGLCPPAKWRAVEHPPNRPKIDLR